MRFAERLLFVLHCSIIVGVLILDADMALLVLAQQTVLWWLPSWTALIMLALGIPLVALWHRRFCNGCPVTRLQDYLRLLLGRKSYGGDFIEYLFSTYTPWSFPKNAKRNAAVTAGVMVAVFRLILRASRIY